VKRKIKRIISILILLLFLIGLIPIKALRDDGGTVEYAAVFYRFILWNQKYAEVEDNSDLLDIKYRTGYHTGTSIYVFPFNFGEKEWNTK